MCPFPLLKIRLTPRRRDDDERQKGMVRSPYGTMKDHNYSTRKGGWEGGGNMKESIFQSLSLSSPFFSLSLYGS